MGEPEITALLVAWQAGDERSLDRLMDAVYPELQRLAHRQLGRRRPGESLESAALANEAYLKLARAGTIGCENRVHFLALCAQVMRRILVDHARRRASAKRGGQALTVVPVDGLPQAAGPPAIELLALDQALGELTRNDPRKGHVVELRYFGGLSVEETAEALGVSVETVKRDWRMARAWLFSALTEG